MNTISRVEHDYGLLIDRALEISTRFGGIDGGHHKAWVIDQMVRALKGCDPITNTHGFVSYGTNADYEQLVAEAKAGDDGPETYEWDEGIAP